VIHLEPRELCKRVARLEVHGKRRRRSRLGRHATRIPSPLRAPFAMVIPRAKDSAFDPTAFATPVSDTDTPARVRFRDHAGFPRPPPRHAS
jgi:hypothetical protein